MAQDNSSSAITKTILILGGSYAGMSIAHHILKHTYPHLPDKETYQVVIVSKASQAFDRPACPRAMISDDMFDQSKLFVSIAAQFEQYPPNSFKFIQGAAISLDYENHTVTVAPKDATPGTPETTTITYHALVLATGASTTSPLFGYTGDEETLKSNWRTLRAALPSAKSIIIAGGGPTGVETAGELGEHLNGRAGFFSSKLANPKVPITLLTSSDKLLPVLRPSLASKAESLLAQVGVTVRKNSKAVSVEPAGSGIDPLATATTVTLADGSTLTADIYINATGWTPNNAFIPAALLASDGRVSTNASTLRVDAAGSNSRVYAVGDISTAARPAVHSILNAIPVLGANIKRDLLLAAGKPESEAGKGRVHKEDTTETQLVPVGRSKGVGAAKGWGLPSLLVWAIKGRDYWLWTLPGLWSGKQWSKE